MYLTITKKCDIIIVLLKEGGFMEEVLIEETGSDITTLNIGKENKLKEYDENIRDYNDDYDKKWKLKREIASLKKYIDLSVEDRIEKLTSIWALLTAIFSYDFLTFWGGEILSSFLITIFCSVPISTIAFYLLEIVFYDKFVQLFSMVSPDLKKLYDIYDELNDDISKVNGDIQKSKPSENASYKEIVETEQKISEEKKELIVLNSSEPIKKDNEQRNLNPMESKTVIVEGFTFGKRKVKKR